jgi:hypothetical protein
MSNESHGKPLACVYAQLPNLRNKNSIFPLRKKAEKEAKVSKHTSRFSKEYQDKLGHGTVARVLVNFPTNLHKVLPLLKYNFCVC